ncbi:hypothetical protein TNCT_436121 [Trichonephila clavata]|uniref:Dehydrogenase/reductase SDR family member 11 n=1 Tax=Trichonephila clavata TaxID=2740835 RepID=A0A8X6M173_TRICU|nr:hypothetical protein TNCT_436121 [Trichonephila clavata]
MLVRLPRAPVLSGGLRRKTQLFSGTLYMAASSKTPPHQSKGPQKFKTSLQVPVFPGSSLLCCHTSCEKTIRHNFIPLSPGLPQDFVATEMERWNGRVALVTGASVGIGAQLCRVLVHHGMTVVGCARSVDKIEAIAKEEAVKTSPGKLVAIK